MTANELIQIAAGEIGYTESPKNTNRTKYGKWFGFDGEPWCMMFVEWCFDKVGCPLPYKTASCSDLLNWYERNRPESIFYTPKPGDVVIYNFGHTGIVERVSGNTITAIEGNTSADNKGSQDNGGGVYRRKRSKSLVTATIRPGYTEEEEEMTQEQFNKMANEWLGPFGKKELPEWAKEEFANAVALGITDGERPMELIPRYQAAIMAKRAKHE